MNESDVVRSLAALAQEVRLRVFRALVVAGKDGLTPGAISEQLGVASNTLSFHLKELTDKAVEVFYYASIQCHQQGNYDGEPVAECHQAEPPYSVVGQRNLSILVLKIAETDSGQ